MAKCPVLYHTSTSGNGPQVPLCPYVSAVFRQMFISYSLCLSNSPLALFLDLLINMRNPRSKRCTAFGSIPQHMTEQSYNWTQENTTGPRRLDWWVVAATKVWYHTHLLRTLIWRSAFLGVAFSLPLSHSYIAPRRPDQCVPGSPVSLSDWPFQDLLHLPCGNCQAFQTPGLHVDPGNAVWSLNTASPVLVLSSSFQQQAVISSSGFQSTDSSSGFQPTDSPSELQPCGIFSDGHPPVFSLLTGCPTGHAPAYCLFWRFQWSTPPAAVVIHECV